MLSLWALFLSAFGAATLLPLQSEAVLVGLLLRQPRLGQSCCWWPPWAMCWVRS